MKKYFFGNKKLCGVFFIVGGESSCIGKSSREFLETSQYGIIGLHKQATH